MHLRQLGLGLFLVPLERLANEVQPRGRVIAHGAVAFEQAVHEAGDHLRMLLGEAFVHDQDVRDDEQVGARRERVRATVALLDDLTGLGRPRDAAGQLLPGLQLLKEEIARGERVRAEHEV